MVLKQSHCMVKLQKIGSGIFSAIIIAMLGAVIAAALSSG